MYPSLAIHSSHVLPLSITGQSVAATHVHPPQSKPLAVSDAHVGSSFAEINWSQVIP